MTYDNRSPNWTGPQVDAGGNARVMQAFGNCGPNTVTERLACAAVLHRNAADDCAAALGIGYQIEEP